jgi:aminoglycoside phosphotransferase (APT) family kinase protein
MMDWRERLARYLAQRLPSAEHIEIGRTSAMPAGASNETIGLDLEVRCDGHEFRVPLVLRPQRTSGILAPYDVSRQYRVMRALQSADVPVPAVAWLEKDTTVLGRPFFLMSRVSGSTLPLFWYGPASARLYAIARALASVHAVNWRNANLEFLANDVEGSPLQVELAPWRQRHKRSGLEGHATSGALYDFLLRNEPADARRALLHGDPNPGNYLLRDDQVAAVLDWELAAIGDPRSDLGFYAALMTVFGGAMPHAGRTVLSDAYAAVTGVSLHSLDYYEAVGLYKMAVIMAGWVGPAGAGYGLEVIANRLSLLFGPQWAR